MSRIEKYCSEQHVERQRNRADHLLLQSSEARGSRVLGRLLELLPHPRSERFQLCVRLRFADGGARRAMPSVTPPAYDIASGSIVSGR